MRYYDLDENGWPRASYARPQPGKDLQHLPDQPREHHRWDGGQWVEDAASIAADWHARIESRADTELQRGVSVTIDGTTYGIRTGPAALALEVGGTVTAERARAKGEELSEPVPTDRGVVDFDVDGLDAIFEAVRAHRRAVVERVRELEGMAERGTISDEELDKWP